jgi:hypothetical protein
MPPRLSDYRYEDWKRLRPLSHALKSLRYDAINRLHVRKPARAGDPAAIMPTLAGRRALVTVAFNDAQAIAWQAALLRRYVRHDVYVIADNSNDDGEAAVIAEVARQAGAPYLRLPASRAQASRSHGLALNWLWRNLVLPGQPEAFGFLDDDIFPTAPDDPFAPQADQGFYGHVRPAGDRWFLWAGFCLFRFAAVKDLPLDFRQDWFIGLDTGGGNWDVLYRHAELARLRQPQFRQTAFRDDIPASDGYVQWIDGWLHESGSVAGHDLSQEKRATVAAMLAPHLEPAEG